MNDRDIPETPDRELERAVRLPEALESVAGALRGTGGLADDSTIPDNLAELCMQARDLTSQVGQVAHALTADEGRMTLGDSLLEIAQALHRVARAVEGQRSLPRSSGSGS